MSVSPDVMIMTCADLEAIKNREFQSGVARGRFEQRMDDSQDNPQSGPSKSKDPPPPDGGRGPNISTTPPPERAPVTEAMTTAARRAFDLARRTESFEDSMKAAIEAAIAAREAQKGKGNE